MLAQTLAGLGCGLHWFNPLAWYGLLQMRNLRELTCDDLVLSCGQQPAGYADVLLDIARSYRHQTYATAVGMAHSNNVESRIMAVLDKTRRHVRLSRAAARTLFVFAAALVCLVGTAQFRTQAGSPVSAAEEEKVAEPAAEAEEADELPAWLTDKEEKPEPVAAAEPAGDDDLPDWMKEETPAPAAEEEKVVEPEAEVVEADELPAWLTG